METKENTVVLDGKTYKFSELELVFEYEIFYDMLQTVPDVFVLPKLPKRTIYIKSLDQNELIGVKFELADYLKYLLFRISHWKYVKKNCIISEKM